MQKHSGAEAFRCQGIRYSGMHCSSVLIWQKRKGDRMEEKCCADISETCEGLARACKAQTLEQERVAEIWSGLPDDPYERTGREELAGRLSRLREAMEKADPHWEMLFLEEKTDQFYWTGSMQDGALVVTPREAVYFVRRDLTCAQRESNFPDIRPMKSFRQIGEAFPEKLHRLYVHGEDLTLKKLRMLRKYLQFEKTADADSLISALRAQKSDWEISCMRKAGLIHQLVIDSYAPQLLRARLLEDCSSETGSARACNARPGSLSAADALKSTVCRAFGVQPYTEALFCVDLCRELIRLGSMGVSRFYQEMAEDALGVCAVGENGLRHFGFDSPTGEIGTSIAAKTIGSARRVIQSGDLILLDIPSGFLGYNTDKSKNYYVTAGKRSTCAESGASVDFGRIQAAHDNCVFIEQETAKLLTPGAVPEELYEKAFQLVDPCFRDGFMNGVKFLGHSVGLCMDEKPVLARGFEEPLAANMTLAVEPKIALPGIGLAGTENTYLIREQGAAVSLTGDAASPWIVEL